MIMTTITIPKEMIKKGDLIAIPRREYEQFLNLRKKIKMPIKEIKQAILKDQKWFYTKEWQKKEKQADEALEKKEYKKFTNADSLLKDLHS